MAVAVGNVGLDVENRGAIHQIRAAHVQNRTEFPGLLHAQKTDAGQPQIVGAERGTGGEDAIRVFPPSRGGRTVGDQPCRTASENCQMSHRWEKSSIPRRASELRNSGSKTMVERRASTSPLCPGDAEFGGKVAVHPGNDLNIDRIHYALTFLKQKVTAKIAASPRLMAAPAEQPE